MTTKQQPRTASDQAMWDSVLGLHTFMERQLAHALQRRFGVGLYEYRALEVLTRAERASTGCRSSRTASAWGRAR